MDGPKAEGGYWENRRLALLKQMERDEAKLNAKLAKVYEAEIAKLGREIASYYQRYGEKNVIEYRKLLVTLSDEDRTLLMERMEAFGKKYPQYAHLLPVRESIYKLNEMEGIQLSMRMQQLEIGAIEQEDLQKHLEKQALRSANLAAEQMGFGTAFYTVDASVIKATVGNAWAGGKAFSERIWGNREKLAAYLNDDFAKAVARGESYERIMREMGKRFENVSKRDMTRLVFTEGTFVFNEAHAQVHEQTFDHYTLSTASDSGVCSQCLGIEAQTKKEPVLFKDRSPGVNFPPLHPGCRCSYEVAVEDWDTWIEQQVSKGGGDSLQKKAGAKPLKADGSVSFKGSFGRKLGSTREEYASSKNVAKTLLKRRSVSVEIENAISKLGAERLASIMAAVDYGISFIGGHARNLKLVSARNLDDGEYAQITRRGDDAVIMIDLEQTIALGNDEMEQIVFHEMAHTAEWRFSTSREWSYEADALDAWRKNGGTLPMTAASSEVLDALFDAGFKPYYNGRNGRIEFSDEDFEIVKSISDYAADGAARGTQDSELIAESIRYVANYGYGKYAIADAIARRFL